MSDARFSGCVTYDAETQTVTIPTCSIRYIREKLGLKCNIVKLDEVLGEEVRRAISDNRIVHIRVRNRSSDETFTRVKSDISRHPDEGFVIFSWYHQKLSVDQITGTDEP